MENMWSRRCVSIKWREELTHFDAGTLSLHIQVLAVGFGGLKLLYSFFCWAPSFRHGKSQLNISRLHATLIYLVLVYVRDLTLPFCFTEALKHRSMDKLLSAGASVTSPWNSLVDAALTTIVPHILASCTQEHSGRLWKLSRALFSIILSQHMLTTRMVSPEWHPTWTECAIHVMYPWDKAERLYVFQYRVATAEVLEQNSSCLMDDQ